ncbi:DsbC family protein [Novosphingobium album (ex Liu et al. 2023)]|uniref:Thiol:disulfide interchange protein n=1 Tax=Novosphingobium album (ex Liu et al. 2023) TaxID=3031130 RepID=A0ABT5WX29_9SPHN|nr:DsbC family protein [Novosphingobium album (ex Liu et al. 2023)]MDE8654453.1 DsbC family protein [Novosphingobium album (ex Liu et al. 2023)]
MKTVSSSRSLFAGALLLAIPGLASAQTANAGQADADVLGIAAAEAESQLHQTFTNLKFEDFGPSPVKGPIYQASAGGRIVYYAPKSEHILFATVYDKNGINVTALAQSTRAQKQLSAIDPAKALVIGPAGAPTVIEFTDPDCPYCRALDRFWAAKAAEGKPVRRLVYFVSGTHPTAAAKAEHILCSPDPAAAFKAIYSGMAPAKLVVCDKGRAKVEADAALVAKVGVSGTPTLIVDGKLISGFQQGELEEFLVEHSAPAVKPVAVIAPATGHQPRGL